MVEKYRKYVSFWSLQILWEFKQQRILFSFFSLEREKKREIPSEMLLFFLMCWGEDFVSYTRSLRFWYPWENQGRFQVKSFYSSLCWGEHFVFHTSSLRFWYPFEITFFFSFFLFCVWGTVLGKIIIINMHLRREHAC